MSKINKSSNKPCVVVDDSICKHKGFYKSLAYHTKNFYDSANYIEVPSFNHITLMTLEQSRKDITRLIKRVKPDASSCSKKELDGLAAHLLLENALAYKGEDSEDVAIQKVSTLAVIVYGTYHLSTDAEDPSVRTLDYKGCLGTTPLSLYYDLYATGGLIAGSNDPAEQDFLFGQMLMTGRDLLQRGGKFSKEDVHITKIQKGTTKEVSMDLKGDAPSDTLVLGRTSDSLVHRFIDHHKWTKGEYREKAIEFLGLRSDGRKMVELQGEDCLYSLISYVNCAITTKKLGLCAIPSAVDLLLHKMETTDKHYVSSFINTYTLTGWAVKVASGVYGLFSIAAETTKVARDEGLAEGARKGYTMGGAIIDKGSATKGLLARHIEKAHYTEEELAVAEQIAGVAISTAHKGTDTTAAVLSTVYCYAYNGCLKYTFDSALSQLAENYGHLGAYEQSIMYLDNE